MNLRQERLDVLDDLQRIAVGRGRNGDRDGVVAVAELEAVVGLRAELHGGDIAQRNDCVTLPLDHHPAKPVDSSDIGRCSDVDRGSGSFELSRRRLYVVCFERGGDVGGGESARGELHRIDPDAHGHHQPGTHVRGRHSRNGSDQGLREPAGKLGHLRGAQCVADEADVLHGGGAVRDLGDDRIVGPRRQQILDLLHLRQDFGHRAVAVGVENQFGLDLCAALAGHRSEILDPARGRDRLRDRGRDKTLHDRFGSARIVDVDDDGRALHERVLTHREQEHRARAHQQDEQTHDDRQDG